MDEPVVQYRPMRPFAATRTLAAALLASMLLFAILDAFATSRPVGVKTMRVYNGAIAYHRESASFGYAVNVATARDAQVEALKQCADARCEIVARLRNDCGAVANGPKRFFTGKGATRAEAETKALRACGAGCEIKVWACSR